MNGVLALIPRKRQRPAPLPEWVKLTVILLCVLQSNVTTDSYDQMDRLIHTIDLAGITGDYAYDEVGNRTKVTDGRSQSTEFAYGHEITLGSGDLFTNRALCVLQRLRNL